MEQLIERVAKAPVGLKVAAVSAAVAVVTILNFFVVGIPWGQSISEMESRTTRFERELQRLNAEFIEKQSIANDLNRFRRERELLEQRLNEALTELPEQANIDEILQSLQDRAQKSGLVIQSIEPKPQVVEGFYARIPIAVTVDGNYHEIATFFDALGRLRRIVNVSELAFDRPRVTNNKVVLSSRFTATTFRFVNADQAAAANRPAGAK